MFLLCCYNPAIFNHPDCSPLTLYGVNSVFPPLTIQHFRVSESHFQHTNDQKTKLQSSSQKLWKCNLCLFRCKAAISVFASVYQVCDVSAGGLVRFDTTAWWEPSLSLKIGNTALCWCNSLTCTWETNVRQIFGTSVNKKTVITQSADYQLA